MGDSKNSLVENIPNDNNQVPKSGADINRNAINCSHVHLCTGTPLIGRFSGPTKNRLNRKPSY